MLSGHIPRCLEVIIVTNAMEPWVETSCRPLDSPSVNFEWFLRNFLPALVPIVSQIQVIYASGTLSLETEEGGRGFKDAVLHCFPMASQARSVFDTVTCDAVRGGGRALPGLYAANGVNKLAGQRPQQVDELAPQRWKAG